MKFLKDFKFTTGNILKLAGLALLAIIIITLAFRLIAPSFSKSGFKTNSQSLVGQSAPAYDVNFSLDKGYDVDDVAYAEMDGSIVLSERNVAASDLAIPVDTSASGDDAEEYEVTAYNANIETRKLADTCGQVAGLKPREDVIFETSNESEKSCNYYFKVKQGSVEEILGIIEALKPKDLDESRYTIKSLVDDYTSQEEILKNKLASIEETLNNAVSAYDEISQLATQAQDVESLAKIIDSKLRIIERLSQEKININTQLERLSRSKAEQLDRLEYTYFRVYVSENKFVNWQDIKDSWKDSIKDFIQDINQVIQDITINLVAVLFFALQFIIYIFIVIFVAKYVWRLIKYVWKK